MHNTAVRKDTSPIVTRRSVLVTALCAGPSMLAFAGGRKAPVYIRGEVTVITWADPQPHLELAAQAGATPPVSLQRQLPPHRDAAGTRELLTFAVPTSGTERTWQVNLPSLAQMAVWSLPRPHIGEVVGVIGTWIEPVTDSPTVDAQILVIDGRAYPLRSQPL